MNQEDRDQIVAQLQKLEKDALDKYTNAPCGSDRESKYDALETTYRKLVEIFSTLRAE